MQTTAKQLTYGDGLAVMILVAEKMGLDPSYVDLATRQLKGESVHIMNAAGIEKEAVNVNNRLRHDASLIAQANGHAELIKAEFGFEVDPNKEVVNAPKGTKTTQSRRHARP